MVQPHRLQVRSARHLTGNEGREPTLRLRRSALAFVVIVVVASLTSAPAHATHTTCQGAAVPHIYLGGSGNDQITGNSSTNVMSGEGGNDKLDGKGQYDIMCGNTGNDRVQETSDSGAGDADQINLGDDCDGSRPWLGPDTVHGGDGNDTPFSQYGGCGSVFSVAAGLYGEDGNDNIYGEQGADLINGQSGSNDWADAGPGVNDHCYFGTTETVLNCEIML